MLTNIAQRAHGEPITLARAEQAANAGDDIEYLRVKTEGQFLHDKERYLFAHDSKFGSGYHVFTPLKRADGIVVFVNRGFVPSELKDFAKRESGQVTGDVEIVGLVRRPEEPGTFTPANDVDGNLWYWRDLSGMAASVFSQESPPLVSFFIDAEAEPHVPGGWPKGGVTRLDLPNRHLAYAVFAAYAISRWRRPDA